MTCLTLLAVQEFNNTRFSLIRLYLEQNKKYVVGEKCIKCTVCLKENLIGAAAPFKSLSCSHECLSDQHKNGWKSKMHDAALHARILALSATTILTPP